MTDNKIVFFKISFRNKEYFLYSIFFFILMGVYALLRELRDCFFITFSDLSYLPYAKYLSLLFIIIGVFFYEKLLEKFDKARVFTLITLFYSIFFLLVSFLIYLELAVIKIPFFYILNWIFYVIAEGFPPFVWGLSWAILNSNSSIKEIKNKYIVLVACNQLGGAFFSFLFYELIHKKIFSNITICFISLLVVMSILLFCSIILMNLLSQSVHSVNGVTNKDQKNTSIFSNSGAYLILKNMYALGIFFLIFLWELINITFNFFRLSAISENNSTNYLIIIENLYYTTMVTNIIGFFIAILGTSFLVRKFGIKNSLFIIPFLLTIFGLIFIFFQKKSLIIYFYIIIRAFYPALIYPIKESLFIPTNFEFQFKAKSWIDSFGSRMGKAVAATYLKLLYFFPLSYVFIINSIYFVFIIILWSIISYFLGKEWQKKSIE